MYKIYINNYTFKWAVDPHRNGNRKLKGKFVDSRVRLISLKFK